MMFLFPMLFIRKPFASFFLGATSLSLVLYSLASVHATENLTTSSSPIVSEPSLTDTSEGSLKSHSPSSSTLPPISGTSTPSALTPSSLSAKSTSTPLEPWNQKRELSHFQSLLTHSPFSLATAEESSPLSERYALTGIVNIDGEDQVFVFDRSDQSRELLSKKPNTKSMALVNIVHDNNNPSQIKATIRVGEETGVISSIEQNNPPASSSRLGAPSSLGGYPGNRNLRTPTSSRYPNMPQTSRYGSPSQPYGSASQGYSSQPYSSGSSLSGTNPANRRIIRRPPIAPQSSSQGMPSSLNQGTAPTYPPRASSGYPSSYSPSSNF